MADSVDHRWFILGSEEILRLINQPICYPLTVPLSVGASRMRYMAHLYFSNSSTESLMSLAICRSRIGEISRLL